MANCLPLQTDGGRCHQCLPSEQTSPFCSFASLLERSPAPPWKLDPSMSPWGYPPVLDGFSNFWVGIRLGKVSAWCTTSQLVVRLTARLVTSERTKSRDQKRSTADHQCLCCFTPNHTATSCASTNAARPRAAELWHRADRSPSAAGGPDAPVAEFGLVPRVAAEEEKCHQNTHSGLGSLMPFTS